MAALFGPAALGAQPLVYVLLYLGGFPWRIPRMPDALRGHEPQDGRRRGAQRPADLLRSGGGARDRTGRSSIATTWTQYNFGGVATDA